MIFKTASGELVPSEGTGTFDRKRYEMPCPRSHLDVSGHKCLFVRIAVLDENGGQLVPVNSKAGRAIPGIINRSAAAEVNT